MDQPDLFAASAPVEKYHLGTGVSRTWRVIWRGRLIVLSCLLALLVPAILYLQQATREYTAITQIMVQTPDTNDALTDRNMVMTVPRITEEVIETEVELISSTEISRRVVDKLHLDQDPEFNLALREPKPIVRFLRAINPLSWFSGADAELAQLPANVRAEMAKARIVRYFQTRLSVKPQRHSYIIAIRFASEDREKAARIANAVAETYVLDRLEASFSEARQVSGWLGERLRALQTDAMTSEAAVERFRSEHNLRSSRERQGTISDQQLSELNSRLVIARSDLAQKQARYQQARALGRSRGSVETSSDVLQSQLIQKLRELEAVKSRELSEATKTYGDRHPRIIGLKAELDDLHAKIATETDKVATSMANDVDIGQAGVASLEREVAELSRSANIAGETAVQLRDLERQAEASKNLYETFLNRFKREAEQTNMRRANARIVSTADIPVKHSSPQTRLVLLITVMLGLASGIGLVFLLENLDNTLRSADTAEALTGLPVLAMVPVQGGAIDHPLEVIAEQPRSALADAIRSLRTALVMGEKARFGRTILITSSAPKEGKTFVALCLAGLFAKIDEKVLLIDCDIYRPRMHSALGVDGSRGLAQLLAGEANFEQVVQTRVSGNLDFLPAGHEGDPKEILQGPQMQQLLADLVTRYDRIIIDSPPVLAVADVRLVAKLADQVVYLVKWGSVVREAVHNGIKLLKGAGVPLSGLVLSQVNQKKHARYGYGDYGQYYGKYNEYYGK